MILGLDPSLNGCGFVVYNKEKDDIVYNDTLVFNKTKDDLPTELQHLTWNEITFEVKINTIAKKLKEVIDAFSIDTIVYERSFGRHAKSVAYVGMVTGMAFAFAFANNCKLVEVHAKTMKKAVTGNGNASKEEVIECVVKRFPNTIFNSDDETDAAGLIITHISGKNNTTKPKKKTKTKDKNKRKGRG